MLLSHCYLESMCPSILEGPQLTLKVTLSMIDQRNNTIGPRVPPVDPQKKISKKTGSWTIFFHLFALHQCQAFERKQEAQKLHNLAQKAFEEKQMVVPWTGLDSLRGLEQKCRVTQTCQPNVVENANLLYRWICHDLIFKDTIVSNCENGLGIRAEKNSRPILKILGTVGS